MQANTRMSLSPNTIDYLGNFHAEATIKFLSSQPKWSAPISSLILYLSQYTILISFRISSVTFVLIGDEVKPAIVILALHYIIFVILKLIYIYIVLKLKIIIFILKHEIRINKVFQSLIMPIIFFKWIIIYF